ncbi:MAG: hypothetical protein Q8O14_07735 [bacterium]|nr:hypothetical protein [bacterium]
MNDRVRSNPRISVNKLGEYMVASAARRRGLVRDQKRPRDFIVARYSDAYTAIREFLVSGGADFSSLDRAISRLETASTTSEWQEQDRQLSIEAIEAFIDLSDSLDLANFRATATEGDAPQLTIAGVSVSVRPELLLQGTRPDGNSTAGAIKLCIAKNSPLGIDAGHYVATVVHQYLTDCLRPAALLEPSACIVLDLFAREIYVAPRSFKRKRTDIEAACEEIARAWSAV